MDLWILCAEKANLIKVDNVYIEEFYDRKMTYYYEIRTKKNDDEICLGCFETKKRALEVLGEIQKLLVGDLLVFTNTDFEEGLADYVKPYKAIAVQDKENPSPRVEFIHRGCVVYEMPQK